MSGSIFAAFLSVAVAVAPATTQPAASSAPSDEDAKLKRAEELFNNGRQLFKEGAYEAAILAFTESYELSKLPDILYNIGNSYEKIGDFANARKYLDQYRAYAPEKERETLTRRIQNLDARLREQDEKARAERDKQPPPDQVDPEKDPKDTPPADPQPQPPPKKDSVFGPATIGLTAVAIVGLGAGIGFGVAAQKQSAEAKKFCEAANGTTFCTIEAEDALSKQKTRALIADISFGVAAAAAIGVIAVVAVKSSRKKSEQRASLAPTFGPRGAGVTFGLRF